MSHSNVPRSDRRSTSSSAAPSRLLELASSAIRPPETPWLQRIQRVWTRPRRCTCPAVQLGEPGEPASLESDPRQSASRAACQTPPLSLAPLSGRYLSFAEREEIAILRAKQVGVRGIARRLGRSPSTI